LFKKWEIKKAIPGDGKITIIKPKQSYEK